MTEREETEALRSMLSNYQQQIDEARAQVAGQSAALHRLREENERLGKVSNRLAEERRALLMVTTTEGLTASEWILRTAMAEERRNKAEAKRDALWDLLAQASEYSRHPDYEWDVDFGQEVHALLENAPREEEDHD